MFELQLSRCRYWNVSWIIPETLLCHCYVTESKVMCVTAGLSCVCCVARSKLVPCSVCGVVLRSIRGRWVGLSYTSPQLSRWCGSALQDDVEKMPSWCSLPVVGLTWAADAAMTASASEIHRWDDAGTIERRFRQRWRVDEEWRRRSATRDDYSRQRRCWSYALSAAICRYTTAAAAAAVASANALHCRW